MYYFLAVIIGYFIGSIPFSLILGKLFYNTDIRKSGSGNLGATNAGRVLGKKAGISVLILDVLKCSFSVVLIYFILKWTSNIENYNVFIYLTGVSTLIGHSFPIFASFKGGKAVASCFGFLLITNFYLFLIGVAIYMIVLIISKIVSLSSMISLFLVSLISFIPVFQSSLFLNIKLDLGYSIILLLVSLFIIYRHKSNIKRIINKKESKVTWIKIPIKNKKES